MGLAAVSTTLNPKSSAAAAHGSRPQTGTRPPLLQSDPENVAVVSRRLKSREVTSRYMSSSSSSSASSACSNTRRCPSPSPSRTGAAEATMTPISSQALKLVQFVEQRRAVTSRPNSLDLRIGNGGGCEMSVAQKLLFSSTRSLSVSFQGEPYSLQVSKAKPTPTPTTKGTPERWKVGTTPLRADQSENSRLVEQQWWPARLRTPNSLTRSLDCTDERKKMSGSGTNVVRALQNSMVNDVNNGKLRSNLCNSGSVKSAKIVGCSDSDSVSSGSSNSGPHGHGGGGGNGCGGVGQGPRPKGIVVPARFWQETNKMLSDEAGEPQWWVMESSTPLPGKKNGGVI